jgi:phosphate transport system permease protein
VKRRSVHRRRLVNGLITAISAGAALLGIMALAWILYAVIRRGAAAINWTFFTSLPTPPGVGGGGLSNALWGTLYITAAAAVIGIPLGLLAGVYLAEFGQHTRLGGAVRFMSNVLMGVPSIIIGLFVYTLMVLPSGHFSGWAGGVSLAIIMLPVVARTSEDMLRLVPDPLRESALALGAPRWRATLGVVFRAARAGLVTGIVLAVARVSGETAPLLFTALNSPYRVESMNEPTANLTVTIFNYAMSPYEDWQTLAWGASLIIMAAVLLLTVLSRLALKEHKTWS